MNAADDDAQRGSAAEDRLRLLMDDGGDGRDWQQQQQPRHASRSFSSAHTRRGSGVLSSLGSRIIHRLLPSTKTSTAGDDEDDNKENHEPTLYLLCLIILLVASCGGFIGLPLTRIMEDLLCRDYYSLAPSDPPPDESRCKEDAIQSRLAFVMSLTPAINACVSVAAAFPWGLVAEKGGWGRKKVFALAVVGLMLGFVIQLGVLRFHNVFPVELVWLGGVSPLLGGGIAVMIGLVLSMVTDITTEETRAIAFLRFHVATLCGELISPSLAGLMMETTSPWAPPFVGLACLATGAIAMQFVPETRKQQKNAHDLDDDQEGEEAGEMEADTAAGNKDWRSKMSRTAAKFRESLSILKSPSLILLFVIVLASAPVMYATLQFMSQYVSKRYGLRLSKTGYVQSAYGVAHMVVAVLVLPSVLKLLVRPSAPRLLRARDEQHRDLAVGRASFALLIFGSLLLGLAPRLPGFLLGLSLMALASGYSSVARSLMSLYVEPGQRARLFSLIGMTETLGRVYSEPMLAGLFGYGLRLGGGWVGLPYYGLAALVAVATGLFFFVKVPGQEAAVRLPEYEAVPVEDRED